MPGAVWNKTLIESIHTDLEAAIADLGDVRASDAQLVALDRLYVRLQRVQAQFNEFTDRRTGAA